MAINLLYVLDDVLVLAEGASPLIGSRADFLSSEARAELVLSLALHLRAIAMPPRRLPRIAEATAPADPQAARLAATTLLARRDFAVRELSERLTEQGFAEGAVSDALSELLHDGVLDDRRYARNYVAYHAGRGHGPLRIAAELRRSGLPGDLIEAALGTGPDWGALARKVCRAKFGPQPPDGWTQRARRARFLQYRGFSSDHIRTATGVESDTGFSEP